jgi:hypothetical protein
MPLVDGHPRPDWAAIDDLISKVPESEARGLWCTAARTWLELTAANLSLPYRFVETSSLLFLMPLKERDAGLITAFSEKALHQILLKLEGLAETDVYGKRVIMVFATQDDYYGYSSHFYPDGEHPLSAGVFLNTEYGHIAMPFHDIAETEATIAHELTHNCLRLLPIPLWLNEGLAVTLENEICGNHPLRMDPDRFREHAAFWNEDTIQEFWSGKSFGRVDEGIGLSYELARYCIRALAHDLSSFVTFARRASAADGGEAAAMEVFEGSLGGLIEQFFGPGDWSPRADGW